MSNTRRAERADPHCLDERTPPKVYDFVDERIDLKTLEAKMMNEPIKGGSRWAYVFGSCLLFIFIMQVITGILLMFYYIPA